MLETPQYTEEEQRKQLEEQEKELFWEGFIRGVILYTIIYFIFMHPW